MLIEIDYSSEGIDNEACYTITSYNVSPWPGQLHPEESHPISPNPLQKRPILRVRWNGTSECGTSNTDGDDRRRGCQRYGAAVQARVPLVTGLRVVGGSVGVTVR
jgi:hypothetical protein